MILGKSLLPWTVGLAVALLVSGALNLTQFVGRMVAERTAVLECEARIKEALDEKAEAAAQAAAQAQEVADGLAIRDTTVERERLAFIVSERDRTLAELRRLQRAATTTMDRVDCRVPADRVRVLNRALSASPAGRMVQPLVPRAL